MIVEDQSAVVDLLSRPETYGLDEPVERIETHIAIVFLAGDHAYKLKRAVRLPYLDYSDAARRHAMCLAEVALNRRTAPDYYLGVVPIVRSEKGLELGAHGNPVDWVVKMRRFDQGALFDKLALAEKLDAPLMRRLATTIADFHRQLAPMPEHGGYADAQRVVTGIAESFREISGEIPANSVREVVEGLEAEAAAREALLDRRRTDGFVRHCHGDLHLRNICLIEGQPMLFDAIEFSEEIAVIDTFYDLAFLIMDLVHRNLNAFANTVFNGYLVALRDYSALPLLPLYLAMRAAIRGLVMATTAESRSDVSQRRADQDNAKAYLDLAKRSLIPAHAVALAIGGLSGSGKTTLAYGLAPELGRTPGAVVLRSDEIRKEIMGADPLTRLGPNAYHPSVSEHVYSVLRERAATILASGQSVICDAVYDRVDSRRSIERTARERDVPFVGIWLSAPLQTMVDRVEERRDDASDATAAVVRRQSRHDPGPIEWRQIDSAGSSTDVLAEARRALAEAGLVAWA